MYPRRLNPGNQKSLHPENPPVHVEPQVCLLSQGIPDRYGFAVLVHQVHPVSLLAMPFFPKPLAAVLRSGIVQASWVPRGSKTLNACTCR